MRKRSKKRGSSSARATVKNPSPCGNESSENRKRRASKILTELRKSYSDADCALSRDNPFQLLIATILSAQSTDETVNKVTPVLFAKFPSAQALARAPRDEIERIIHATGFFRQKAKSIQGTALKIVEDFGGDVPQTLDELTTLPGVARKTANVVLGTAFGINEGVVVDTHIGRLAWRLGLTWNARDTKDAVKIERDLMEVIPRKEWTFIGHALIQHGRKICSARKPKCDGCSLVKHCPSAYTFDPA